MGRTIIDTTDYPLVRIRMPAAMDRRDIDRYFEALEADVVSRPGPKACVIDSRPLRVGGLSARDTVYVAQRMRALRPRLRADYRLEAIVLGGEGMRLLAETVGWLMHRPWPVAYFATVEKAERAALKQLGSPRPASSRPGSVGPGGAGPGGAGPGGAGPPSTDALPGPGEAGARTPGRAATDEAP